MPILVKGGGGINPTGTRNITTNGLFTVRDFEYVDVDVDTGITPSGTKFITSTSKVDVSSYQYAQVSDTDLVASNIKSGVNILGVVGTYVPTFT